MELEMKEIEGSAGFFFDRSVIATTITTAKANKWAQTQTTFIGHSLHHHPYME
jgi:hypothetical protein